MSSGRILKYLRRTVAVILGAAMLALFLDINHIVPRSWFTLANIQIVPLLMKGALGMFALMLVLALIFGRWYCSVLCPLGILQDAVGRTKKWFWTVLGKKKKLRMRYQRPLNALRYGVFGAVAIALMLGVTLPLTALDPYSNFGRIATGLLRPVAVWINNALAGILNQADNYTLYAVQNLQVGMAVVLSAAAVLLALVIMVWLSGRLWCNTLCPVGTMLGFFSRFSLFRIRIDASSCNGCGNCQSACKARCIDSGSARVDASRCVSCFNCLDKCNRGAIAYVPAKAGAHDKVTVKPVAAFQAPGSDAMSAPNGSRREFLKGSLAALAAIPAASLLAADGKDKAKPKRVLPMPPGAGSRKRFESKCTACQLCVTACPTQVLQPAMMENGLTGVMQPYMRFKVESFCNFECTACMDICPNHAIEHLSLEEKKLTQVGIARFYQGRCVVNVKHWDCGACAEHCPTQAVHMVPWKDGLTIPHVDPEYCIGCGGCESICPVKPRAAIMVIGLDEQALALPPKTDDFEAGEVSDFGF